MKQKSKETHTSGKLIDRVGEIFDNIAADNKQAEINSPVPDNQGIIKAGDLSSLNTDDNPLLNAIIEKHKIKQKDAFMTSIYRVLNECKHGEALKVVNPAKFSRIKGIYAKKKGILIEEVEDNDTNLNTIICRWVAAERYNQGTEAFNNAQDNYVREVMNLSHNKTELLLMQSNVLTHAYEKSLDDDDPSAVKWAYAFNNGLHKELDRQDRDQDRKAGVGNYTSTPAFIINVEGDAKIVTKEADKKEDAADDKVEELTAEAFFLEDENAP